MDYLMLSTDIVYSDVYYVKHIVEIIRKIADPVKKKSGMGIDLSIIKR